jgi:circadian clock protein KaiC
VSDVPVVGNGRPVLPRIPSGNRELDEILGGGFPANSINIVMGEPGSGKTILAESVVFANAMEGDRPILYITTLSEPLDKVVRYLQQFAFYDARKMASAVLYESLGDEMATQGVGALVARIRDALKTMRPKIVVVDSFKAIHDVSTETQEMRRMLYDLAGLLTAYETTAFLVGEYSEDQIHLFPEFAIADGTLELARRKLGSRDERFLRVLKLRGSAYREGLHAFRICEAGLDVYPRLAMPRGAPRYDVAQELVPTGVPGLDRMMGGGLRPGRATFLLGPTGSGKTTLALQFALEGVRRGERSLYLNLEENPTQLASQIAGLGADPKRAMEEGLELLYAAPVELQIDSLVAGVFGGIRDRQVRRVVVDGVGELVLAAADERRLHGYLYALLQHLSAAGVASVFTYETRLGSQGTDLTLSPLADNLIQLGVDLGERMRRSIRIIKARATEHDLSSRELEITRKGVLVR